MEPNDNDVPGRSQHPSEEKRNSFLQRIFRHRDSTARSEDEQGENIPMQEFTTGQESSSGDQGGQRRRSLASTLRSTLQERWKKTGNVARFVSRLQHELDQQRDEGAPSFDDDFSRDRRHGKKTEESHDIVRGFQFGGKESFLSSDDNPEENINDIVDKDDNSVEYFVSHHLVGHFVNCLQFRILIFVLILLSSLLVGLQTDPEISVEYRYVIMTIDQIVMAIFICEILLKWYYGFWIFWKDGWNIMDFLIILGMVLAPEFEFLKENLNIRVLRVFRAFRSLRSVGALAGLSMVAQTIISSIPDMANIGMLLGIIIVVFGVMGTTLFVTILPKRFSDLPTAMFSLFICVTQDGWVDIYNEFREQGLTSHIGGCVYLFCWIMVGAFVFMNLVVAVVVTNLERAMKEFADERKAQNALTGANDNQFDGLNSEKTNLVGYNATHHGADARQEPFELTTLRGLSVEKLEKYLTLLTVFEENLVEYQMLRKDLLQVYDVVRTLNAVMEEEIYAKAEEETEVKVPLALDLTKGDIMSNIMKIKDKSVFSDKFQQYF